MWEYSGILFCNVLSWFSEGSAHPPHHQLWVSSSGNQHSFLMPCVLERAEKQTKGSWATELTNLPLPTSTVRRLTLGLLGFLGILYAKILFYALNWKLKHMRYPYFFKKDVKHENCKQDSVLSYCHRSQVKVTVEVIFSLKTIFLSVLCKGWMETCSHLHISGLLSGWVINKVTLCMCLRSRCQVITLWRGHYD